VHRAIADHGITHIVHLAALQVPFCRADPILGARVNVVGTINVFEAARDLRDQVRCVSYASSAAVFGPEDAYGPDESLTDAARLEPGTLYGVYKQANEGTARVYWQDYGVRSVGLRPWTVYGVGRDQGMTSDPTKAIKAAVLGRSFSMALNGWMDLQYADDVARIFLASCERAPDGAPVFNLSGDQVSMDQFVAEVERQIPAARGLIRVGTQPTGIAWRVSDSGLREVLGSVPHTPLEQGIADTIARFRDLLARGELDASELPAAA
jgi:UDP-glucose 4-epimerase